MKTPLNRVGVRLMAVALMAFGIGSAHGADDINQLFQMGRSAYYKGDMETAHKLLTQVQAQQPNHFETKALLAQIRTQWKPGEVSLKKTYDAVTLPKVDFSEVTLMEALEGLRVLSKNATGDKVVPNFIVKDPALQASTAKVSLTLRDVPLNQVITYLGDLANAKVTYDKHAVIFSAASATAGN